MAQPLTLVPPPLVAPGDLTLFVVSAEQLDDYWALARPAVIAVHEETHPRWSVERVYHWLAMKQAFLNLTFFKDEPEPVGVTVVCADGDPMAVRGDALLLFAWADKKNQTRGISEAVLRFTDEQIAERCKAAGFRVLRCMSPRPGLLGKKKRPGAAIKLGYKLAGYIFVKEL